MTILLEIIAVAAVVFVAAAYALGHLDGGLAIAPPDAGSNGLPDGRLPPDAIDRTRFGLAFRGYRMAEVDDALDRLRDELAGRDAEIDALRGHDETPFPATDETPFLATDETPFPATDDDSATPPTPGPVLAEMPPLAEDPRTSEG